MAAPKSTFSLVDAPETFFPERSSYKAISRLAQEGTVRRLGPRLYTKNLQDEPKQIVGRNLWQIVAGYFPTAVVADRTAIENRPAEDGSVFLVRDGRPRTVDVPGLTIKVRAGAGPLAGDMPFVGGLHLSSEARALLENLRPSRSRSGPARTLGRAEVERRLTEIAAKRGEGALNEIRDQARSLAPALGCVKEYQQLDAVIGALFGTKQGKLSTKAGEARRSGSPFDPDRVELFDLLFAELRRHVSTPRLEHDLNATFAFYEAYFSNYIEGTEFLVEEAKAIVFEGRIPAARPEDAHDILGTFRLVSDPVARREVPADIAGLERILRNSHRRLLEARPEAHPGRFKEEPNRAGSLTFVDPDLVQGTLAVGFERYLALDPGFQRAVYQAFMLTEVHPFDDGNGRLARALMNAELSAAGEQRLMITTAQRDAYLGALRALSFNKQPRPLVRVLDVIQRFSLEGDWSDDAAALSTLSAIGAFDDPYTSGGGILDAVEAATPGGQERLDSSQ